MFLHYLSEYQTLGLIIIFFGMMIEGDILLFTVGFLTHQGYFDIGTMLLIVFFGVIIGDNLWYVLGEVIKENSVFGRFITRVIKPFDEHLKKRTVWTIFISKFTYGLHRSTLIRAGMLRLPFKKFIEGDISASIVWIFLIGGLGYLSSASFILIKYYLRYTELTLLFGLILFILISHLITHISKKKL